MKKSEFKRLIKETVRECIFEVIVESGAISNIVAEVMKGVNTAPVLREQKEVTAPVQDEEEVEEDYRESDERKLRRKKLQETRQKMLDAVGKNAYNGVNLFEGTTPAPAPSAGANAANPLSGMAPDDPGVDISGIMALGGAAWKQSMKGKGK